MRTNRPFLRRLRSLPYTLPYALLRRLVSIRPGRVLFLSDTRDGFSDNFAFLRDELHRQAPDADVIGLFKPRLDARRRLRDAVRLPLLVATAQTIVLDDYYPLIYPLRIRPESRLVQVWHAAGAFKRVGWSRRGMPGGPPPGSTAHKNYTDVIVSSESIRTYYAEAFDLDTSRVHAMGVPRTDAFFDKEGLAAADRATRARYGIPGDKRIVLFAPTFRGNGQVSASYDYDSVDWDALSAALGRDTVLLVKMHPYVAPLTKARPWVRSVIDVSDQREITELLAAADLLVTDYSSAIFEYALLRRPIVFFCPDLDEYTADRDFYRPFREYVVGPLARDTAELAEAIRSATIDHRLPAFLDRFMNACDGESSSRITREILLNPVRRPAQGASESQVTTDSLQ